MAANAHYALRYLQERHKLAPHQAAALVGTWQQESGMNLNTGARNPGDGRDGTDSIGIAQWNSGRANGLKSFAADRGSEWTNLDTQIDYAIHELTKGSEKQWGDRLFAAGDVNSAARAAISFERPQGWSVDNPTGGHGWGNRFANAQRLLGASPEEIAAAQASSAPMPAGGAPQARGGMLAMGGGSVLAMPSVANALMGTQVASNDPSFMPASPAQNAITQALQPAQVADDNWGDSDPEVDAPAQPAMQAPPVEDNSWGEGDDTWGESDPEVDQAAPIMANPNAIPADRGGRVAQQQFSPDLLVQGTEATPSLRAEASFASTPEDKLAIIRKQHPLAQPYGEDNFVYPDPERPGQWAMYKQEGLRVPSMGDLASIMPDIAEMIGAGVGAIGGGIGGAGAGGASGSVVPVVGTAVGAGAGAVTGAMLGAGAGGATAKEAANGLGNWWFGNEDTRSLGQRAVDMGNSATLNMLGEGGGRLASEAVTQGGKAVLKRALGTTDVPTGEMAGRAADFRGIGVEPTVGMVTNKPSTAVAEQALAAHPVSGARVQQRIDDVFQATDDEFSRIRDGVRTNTNPNARASSEQAIGEALREQAGNITRQFDEREEFLYGEARALMGNQPAQGANTVRLMNDLKAEGAGMGNHAKLTNLPVLTGVLDQANAIVQDVASGTSFEALKQSRTAIRELREASTNKTEKRYLGRLYDSLTADMEATASAVSPEALQAYKKANNFTRRGYDEGSAFSFKTVAEPIKNAAVDEKIMGWVRTGSKEGGSRLRVARQQIEKAGGAEAWDRLAAGVLEELGTKKVGDATSAFDGAHFVKQWRSLSEEAKGELFRGSGRRQFREDLDRLARVVESTQRYTRRGGNNSGTAKWQVMMGGLLSPWGSGAISAGSIGAMTGDVATTAITGLGGLAAGAAIKGANTATRAYQAQFLTDPRVVNWAANLPQTTMRRNGMQAAIGDLMAFGKDAALRESVVLYLRNNGFTEQADQVEQQQ